MPDADVTEGIQHAVSGEHVVGGDEVCELIL